MMNVHAVLAAKGAGPNVRLSVGMGGWGGWVDSMGKLCSAGFVH